MKISVQDNPLKAGQKRIVLHTGRRFTLEQFLAHAEGSSTLTRADCLAVLNCAAEWVKTAAASGREADLGPLGRSRLGMKGTFDGSDEKIEDADVKMTISWILPPEMKRFAAKAGNNVLRERTEAKDKAPAVAGAVRILPDARLDDTANRYGPGQPLRIDGWRLNYDTSQPDEGVFLIAEDGSETKIETVVSVMPKQLVVMMAADAAGIYRLEVRRRHKTAGGSLLKGVLSHRLVPA